MHERQSHLPDPVRQQVLPESQLVGMERPTQSFKSFIRTAPHKPAVKQKPLPPTLPTLVTATAGSSSPFHTPQSRDRDPSDTSWKAPTEWEWDESGPPTPAIKASALFPARIYSPLLPEPSPEPSIMQRSWSFELSPLPQPRLKPIKEALIDRPALRPRNTVRQRNTLRPRSSLRSRNTYTLSVFRNASEDCDLRDRTMSTWSRTHSLPSPIEGPISPTDWFPEFQSYGEETHTAPKTSPGINYSFSDASTKRRAYASLGIGSPRESRDVGTGWTSRQDSSLEGSSNQPGPALVSPSSEDAISTEETTDTEMNDKMRHVSFSPGAQDDLSCQYPESPTQPLKNLSRPRARISQTGPSLRPSVPPEYRALVPQPLTWTKDSDDSSSSTHSEAQEPDIVSTPPSKKIHKRIASLVTIPHLHQENRRQSSTDAQQIRRPSPSTTPEREQSPPPEINKVPVGNSRLPNFLVKSKVVKTYQTRRRAASLANSRIPSPSPSSSKSTRPEKLSTILRLPGGLMIVRQPTSTALRADNVSDDEYFSTSNLEQPSSPVSPSSPLQMSSPVQPSSPMHSPGSIPQATTVSQGPTARSPIQFYRPPSSVYSQPRGSISTWATKRLRSRSNPLSPVQSRSSGPSVPESPLSQNMPSPRMPPPIPTRRPTFPQPSSPKYMPSYGSDTQVEKSYLDITPDEETSSSSLLQKARDVRTAWEVRKKEAKHNKLKQSIRMVGLTDSLGLNETMAPGAFGEEYRPERISGFVEAEPI